MKPSQAPNASSDADARARRWALAVHDVAQPVQALALFANRLRKMSAGQPAAAVVSAMEVSLRELQHLQQLLVQLARWDAGSLAAHHTTTSIAAVFERLGPYLCTATDAQALRIALREGAVCTDPALLHLVLVTLVKAALKRSSSADGSLVVACRSAARRPEMLHIVFWRTGGGPWALDLAHIFQSLVDSAQATSPSVSGAGLELYIAARLIKVLGITPTLRTSAARGAVLTLGLPRAAPALANPQGAMA